MKTAWMSAAAGCLLGTCLTASAATPPPPPTEGPVIPAARSPDVDRSAPEMQPPDESPGPGPRNRPMERWLDEVRERDPQEFERLQTLRKDNPQAFREELRGRLMEARKRLVGSPGPQGEGGHRMRGGEGGTNRPAIFPRDMPPPITPEAQAEWRQAEEQLRALARAWRDSADPGVKKQKAEAIRAILARLFDLRDKEQQAYLKAMEDRLQEVRSRWDERRAQRDEHIEHRLQQILSPSPRASEPPSDANPPPPGAA